MLEIRDFAGTGRAFDLMPALSKDNEPFVDGLADGRLDLQRCSACAKVRWPIGPVCPYCASAQFEWSTLDGRGTVHSWVRFHRPFLEHFAPLGVYSVLVVEMKEGVRIPGRLVDPEVVPHSGMEVRAIIELWPEGGAVHAFTAEGMHPA